MYKELSYDEFKEQLIMDVKEKLPQYNILTNQVQKNNITKDSISGLLENKHIAPTIYINDFYFDYNYRSISYDEVLQNVIDVITSCENDKNEITREGNDVLKILKQLDDIKNNVLPRIVCTKTNTELLSTVIHRNFLDMSVYYVIQLKYGEGVASIKITEGLLKSKGLSITEEQLFKWSIDNLKQYDNYVISMPKLVNCIRLGLDQNNYIGYDDNDLIVVISNNNNVNGANNILNNKILNEISDTLNSDLYILPSSIHELIVVPINVMSDLEMTKKELKDMVLEVNSTTISNEDKLTDSVYLYNRNTNEVTIA